MKHLWRHITAALLIGGPLLTDSHAGLLDQVIQQATPSSASPHNAPPPANTQGGGLIDGLGGALGVDPKKLDLIKKGVQTVQAMQPIGEEAERMLGESIGIEAFSRYGGLYRDEALTRYVNLVGRTVAEVTERPGLEYRFAILDSREENAFAAPGGYIFVTIGLLRSLKNEAELAGVLGHELAHVNRKHMLNTLQRSSVLSNISDLSMSAMNQDPKLLGAAIDQMNDLLFTHGIDKDLEFEADRFGLEYAQRAGYAPSGLQAYLHRLARSQGGATRSVFFTTHPPVSDRLQRVDGQLTRLPPVKGLALLEERWKRHTAKL
ncbi:MAG: M48 family metalloprotease [Magnetococcales bacterium]|nr:M48 family metalloprotease [Magnetococcales bacterium]